MKAQVTIDVITTRLVPVACDQPEAPEPTLKLPKLVHLEGWRSDGQSPDQVLYSRRQEGGQQCNR
jgi:hypothetical protein